MCIETLDTGSNVVQEPQLDILYYPKLSLELGVEINKETLNTYRNEIMDKHVLQDHLNVIRLLKTDHYINEKLKTAKDNSYDIKNMTMIYSKVKAIRNLETKYNIGTKGKDQETE